MARLHCRTLALSFLALLGCAHIHSSAQRAMADAPDLSPMVEFVGRWGVSHGCPTGPWEILTAAHVPDERPFDESVALYPQRMQANGDSEDLAVPVTVDRAADIALMRPANHRLTHWFARAEQAPKPGERIWTLGYHRDRAGMFQPRPVSATVVRVIAGHIVLTFGAKPGSSGACWVNRAGEAVGVGVWDLPIDLGEPAGLAVGLWEPWKFGEGKP